MKKDYVPYFSKLFTKKDNNKHKQIEPEEDGMKKITNHQSTQKLLLPGHLVIFQRLKKLKRKRKMMEHLKKN